MLLDPTQPDTRGCEPLLSANPRQGSNSGLGRFGTHRDAFNPSARQGLRDEHCQPHVGGGAFGNPFAHQGLQLDPEIGSYQNRARQYAPKLKRFMQRDPATTNSLLMVCGWPTRVHTDGTNLYQYVMSNPTSNMDYSGLACVTGTIRRTTYAEYRGGWWCKVRNCARCRVCQCGEFRSVFDTPCTGWYSAGAFTPPSPPAAPKCKTPAISGPRCCAFARHPTRDNCKECCWETATSGSGPISQFDLELAKACELDKGCDAYP